MWLSTRLFSVLPCERTLPFNPCFESGPTFHAPCLDVKVILVVDVAPRLYVLYKEKYQRVGFLRHLVDKLLKGLNKQHTLLQMFLDLSRVIWLQIFWKIKILSCVCFNLCDSIPRWYLIYTSIIIWSYIYPGIVYWCLCVLWFDIKFEWIIPRSVET